MHAGLCISTLITGRVRCLQLVSATSMAVVFKPMDPVKVKEALKKQGIGMEVKLTETDGTHVTGILTAIHDTNFELTPKNTFQPTVISYEQVMAMQMGKSTIAKVGTGIGIASRVYLAVVVVAFIVIIAVEAHSG